MTVYLVQTYWEYEGGNIEAVFTTEKLANAFVEASRDGSWAKWSVTEHEVLESLPLAGETKEGSNG